MAFGPKHVLACAALVLALLAQAQTNDTQQAHFAAMAKTMHLVGSWQGTTPCADCSGIVTTLTLYQKAPDASTNTLYRQNLNYLGKNTSFTSYGTWKAVHGMPDHPDATVYQLNPGKGHVAQYYWRVDDDSVQMLGSDMKPIDSPMNLTLKRISPPQKTGIPNPASVNCTKHGGTLKIETEKDGGQIGICTFPNGKQCEEWAFMRNECSPDTK